MPNPVQPSTPVVIQPKIGKNVLEFWAILLLIVLILGSGVAFGVAKSGLVRVPFFSRFYHGPQITRQVRVAPVTGAAFMEMLRSRFLTAAVTGGSLPARVRITEQELTAVLDDAIGKATQSDTWTASGTQLVIRPTGLEFYGQFVGKQASVNILIRLVPKIEGPILHFVPVFVQLGDYPIPPSVADKLAALIYKRDFGQWNVAYGEMQVTEVVLTEGVLELDAMPRKSMP